MSRWIIPKPDDISLEDGEIHIHIGTDSFGNNYISLEGETFEKIKELLLNNSAEK